GDVAVVVGERERVTVADATAGVHAADDGEVVLRVVRHVVERRVAGSATATDEYSTADVGEVGVMDLEHGRVVRIRRARRAADGERAVAAADDLAHRQ